jgi:hypothetical protein
MHEMFLGSKESLFGVYFGFNLVPINEWVWTIWGPKLA